MVQFDFTTPIGIARITDNNGFISSISIADKHSEIPQQTSPAILLTIQQLEEYFAGQRKNFDLPIRQEGSVFQQDVWLTLLKIPYGKTISYATQAEIMGNPLAIRAMAAANGKNHLCIVVPCHRVIGSDGSLTGYAGGLWRKQWLLKHEATVCGIGQTSLF